MLEFEAYIQKSMQFWQVPGCAIAIAKEGEILLAKGFGKKRLADDSPSNQVDRETLFQIASLTKLFTAAAVGLLVEENQMHWDDPVIKYLPDLKLSDSYAQQHLTLSDCLSMHSGLPGESATDLWYHPNATQEELISKLPLLPFTNGFRGSFAYQNLLYLLVAKALEKQQGLSWEKLIANKLLDPLKMHKTESRFASFLQNANRASPHKWEGDKIKEAPYENIDNLAPAAGLSSCAEDMGKWLAKLTDSKSPIAQAIFSPKALATPEGFFPANRLELKSVFFPECQFLTYGYGCFVHDYKGIALCQTPGLSEGMTALLIYAPQPKLAIAILTNLEAPYFAHAVAFHLIDTYLGKSQDWDRVFLSILKKLG